MKRENMFLWLILVAILLIELQMYVIYKQSSSIQEANHLLNRADSLIKRSTQVIRECSDETDYWANKYFEEAMRNIE